MVVILCPNVTIRDRLGELDPQRDEQSLYRTRDLVPKSLMDQLRRGKVIVTNWHVLEPREMNQVGGDSSKVVRRGQPRRIRVKRTIDGKRVEQDEIHYYESDTALVNRVLGRHGVGGKQNILVLNDEGHHAYRLRQEPAEEEEEPEEENGGDEEAMEYWKKEATVWIDGLDKIQKLRGINFCVDLSATPYYLNRTGNEPGRPFPWVVSDFSLVDAIESGLVKIPQVPIQDATGEKTAAYFNIWKWIIEKKLSRAQKGGRRGQVSPKAVLQYAHVPIALLAGLWRETFEQWKKEPEIHPTPPVFILVCRDTRLAKAVYEWVAEGKSEAATPIEEFRNRDGFENTVRVDSKVVEEIESGAKSDESRRLRYILETVGRTRWPNDKPPEEWVSLAERLGVDPFIPPGRNVRCIISVGMLNEGWDATTVTHVVGLRPFTSQLLCEQVVGRALRRSQYQDLSVEEEAKVYGVPFEVIPFKAPPQGVVKPPPRIHHVYAVPERADLAISFPRVERYVFNIKHRLDFDWNRAPSVVLDPMEIPHEVRSKGVSWSAAEQPTLEGPGKISVDELRTWCETKRLQALEFEMARTLTRSYMNSPGCEIPAQVFFARVLPIVRRFVQTKVEPKAGFDRRALFLDPFWSWAIDTLLQNLIPDAGKGETPELPVYEAHRGPGSTADVDFWTARDTREILNSHVNCVVADTRTWEQSAAYFLDRHENIVSFVKNAGLGFAIPYTIYGEHREYEPDFLIRVKWKGNEVGTLILETKGQDDPIVHIKKAAALRWVAAVNNDGKHGMWDYRLVYRPVEVVQAVAESAEHLSEVRGRNTN